jgi:hypothetical protein
MPRAATPRTKDPVHNKYSDTIPSDVCSCSWKVPGTCPGCCLFGRNVAINTNLKNKHTRTAWPLVGCVFVVVVVFLCGGGGGTIRIFYTVCMWYIHVCRIIYNHIYIHTYIHVHNI